MQLKLALYVDPAQGIFFAPVLILTVQMRELMREFEAHKKAFHQDSPEMYIELPSVLHRLTVPGRIDQGELTITKYVQIHVLPTNIFAYLQQRGHAFLL